MKKVVPAVLLLGCIVACVPKSQADQLVAENTRLQSQVIELQAQVSKLNAELSATKSRLSDAGARLARKPEMPVQVRFRRALTGPGFVAIFNTTIKQGFPVVVRFHSTALGTDKSFQLNLDPNSPRELGHLEGAAIYSGDQLTVENNLYEPILVSCPQ